MTSQEFADWGDYYAAEPWGAERDNWHAAVIAVCVSRALGKPLDERRLMYRGVRRRPSIEVMRAVMMRATQDMEALHGGRCR